MSDRLSDKCNPHPEAPHGFDRNSSATEDRYVCDCEHWQPPDDLRTRIVAVQLEHIDRQLTNYDTGREECGCGQQGNATYMEHLADAVIRELGLREEHRERSHGNWPNQPQVIYRKQRRYISEWENDE